MSMLQTSQSPAPVSDETMPPEQAVVRAIVYADVFDYPLQGAEVHRYLHGVAAPWDTTATALARCCAGGKVLRHRDGFYTLPGREGLVDLRRRRAVHAERLWPTAVRYGHVIASLPFVRMVAVTGSLAWDNVKDSGDIDYLVVTEAGRLWLCRWLIAALGRLARLDGVHLCPNYIVSTRALLLTERNLYGAYELARMTPIVGLGTYRRLRRANPWAAAYLPNALEAPPRPPGSERWPVPDRRGRAWRRLARLGEQALRSPLGSALERYEMAYRIRKRERQESAGGETAYGTDWYKGHTRGHRQRALALFAERLRGLSEC